MGICRFRYPILSSYAGSTTELDYMEYATDGAAQAAYVASTAGKLQSYSGTIKAQGTYSLKLVADATDDGSQYVYRTIGAPIDLTGKKVLKLQIYATADTSDWTLEIYDTTTGAAAIVSQVLKIYDRDESTWKQILIDISDIADGDKNTVDGIKILHTAAGAATIYIDDLKAVSEETLTIASIPVQIPLPITPAINQITSEAISGVRQTAELGNKRDMFTLAYQRVSNAEYINIINFFESLTLWKLNPFEYTQLGIPQSWFVFLEDFSQDFLDYHFHAVTIKLVERIAET